MDFVFPQVVMAIALWCGNPSAQMVSIKGANECRAQFLKCYEAWQDKHHQLTANIPKECLK